ncbi:MAG: helix-turn-helix transcriptional regulator [Lachnospirales bacterium]
MAKSNNQKRKLIYIRDMLLKNTDINHYMTMNEIIENLAKNDIKAERKSIYNDIETLRDMGIDIECNRRKGYAVISRDFELVEIKMLVDAVQSSRFITARKSMNLIKKLENFVSSFEANNLQRQVFVLNKIKSMNESIYYTLDLIYDAMAKNSKIKFKYFKWNINKEQELKKDGKFYVVSPWHLCWDNTNYYLIAYDSTSESIKHFRIDKMLRTDIVKEDREGKEIFNKIDMAVYSDSHFSMFGGNIKNVTLQCNNDVSNVIIDRFGKNISILKSDDENFTVNVKVAVSDQFLGWIFGLGGKVKIVEPLEIKERMKELAVKYI